MPTNSHEKGVTLIETIVFLVVVSIGLTVLTKVFTQSVSQSVDPAMRLKALERGHALMDQILVRRFDENTPTGGVPACGSTEGVACAGITPDADYDDVGDYNGFNDSSDVKYPVTVGVINAGTELGLNADAARRVTVVVAMADGNSVTLSAYKVNF